ncbi:Flp pilus assembly pilin Flp [Nocardiopsis mwathae]|uniref:Flp pilus assembly pilin Flp n=1 Tax=Nocardiopsis mwathae TaxID=1472723 RepID=A0A7W9YEK8_9ACTN|nr:hypothetical protein [Nocardiopsis mwathae]MBB6170652.1 Flp pilus assembly pilin Flp [Nocardiopsis mwathae]
METAMQKYSQLSSRSDFDARNSDTGASFIEYSAVGLVISVMTVAVISTTDLGDQVTSGLTRAICQAFGGDNCDNIKVADKDYQPEHCMTGSNAVSTTHGGAVAVNVDGGFTIIEKEKSDGTVEVSLVRSVGVGADAPLPTDWGVNFKGLVDVEASIGAGLEGEGGYQQTWTFDNASDAAAFKDDVSRAMNMEGISEDSGAFGGLGSQLSGAAKGIFEDEEIDLPKADREAGVIEVGGKVEGGAGVSLGNTQRKIGESKEDHAARKKASTGIDLVELLSGDAKGKVTASQEVDNENNTVSDTVGFKFEQSGEVGEHMPESIISEDAAANTLDSTQIKTTYDRDTEELVGLEIQIVAVDEDNDDYRVNTTDLQVTDENRDTVMEWMEQGEPLMVLEFMSTTGQPKDVASHPDDDPRISDFDRLLHEEGTYSTVGYDRESGGEDWDGSVTLFGQDVGLSTGWDSESLEVSDARYLGAPNEDGKRELIEYEDCTS